METGVVISGVHGNDIRITRTYSGFTDVLITKAWLTLKANEAMADNLAAIQKVIDTNQTSDGEITDADSTGGTIGLYFDIDHDETTALQIDRTYYYDIQIKRDSDEIYTCEKGTISFAGRVTQALT